MVTYEEFLKIEAEIKKESPEAAQKLREIWTCNELYNSLIGLGLNTRSKMDRAVELMAQQARGEIESDEMRNQIAALAGEVTDEPILSKSVAGN